MQCQTQGRREFLDLPLLEEAAEERTTLRGLVLPNGSRLVVHASPLLSLTHQHLEMAMAKLKYGIQNNMGHPWILDPITGHYRTVAKFRQDLRSTAEVEESRDPTNGKPYRNKRQKAEARADAKKQKTGRFKGTFVSHVDRTRHPNRLDANGNLVR